MEDLKQLFKTAIDETITDQLVMAQGKLGIESGEIDPLTFLELEETAENLVSIMEKIISSQRR